MTDRGAVVKPAAQPEGDLACDFQIASQLQKEGFRERLAREIVPPVRRIDGGVEVTFSPQAWDLVLRYIEVESQCCPFLHLAARKVGDAVLLSVTGRLDAQEVIESIFTSAGAGASDCC